MLFFDEIGMAEQSPNNPLKVLHKLFDDFAVSTKDSDQNNKKRVPKQINLVK